MMRRKTMILRSFMTFVLGSVILTSCLDDSDPVPLDAVCDVYVQTKVVDGEQKYGMVLWSWGNKELEKVSVLGPNDSTWVLDREKLNERVFTLKPGKENFTDTIPADGDYKFTVSSTQKDEDSIDVIDKLEEKTLGALKIDDVYYENKKMNVKWQKLEDADGYVIRMYDDSDELLFTSDFLSDDKNEYDFDRGSRGWLSPSIQPEEGKTYRIEMLGVLYEKGATSYNSDYNIQFLSIASKDAKWEEIVDNEE